MKLIARWVSNVSLALGTMLLPMPLLPKAIRTVSISTSGNNASSTKLADHLQEAIASEFLAHTHYRLVPYSVRADVILVASINNYTFQPVLLDPATAQPSAVETDVTLRVMVRERSTGRVLFDDPKFEVRQRYQIGPGSFQVEDNNDLLRERAAISAARGLVGRILEGSGKMRGN